MLPPDVEPIINGRRGYVVMDEADYLDGVVLDTAGAGVTLALVAGLSAALPALAQDATPSADPAEFSACLARLKGTPAFSAVSGATFAQATTGLAPDPSVLVLLNRQPEFTTPVWDYLAVLDDAERVQDGRAAFAKWQGTLQKIEQQTDVPAAVVGYGTPEARSLGHVSLAEMRELAAAGHFGAGSMGPKVDAACTFVAGGGRASVITSLERLAEAVTSPLGAVGTVVTAAGPASGVADAIDHT